MNKLFKSYKNLNNKSGAGFTIIELLVVVAIIAVLTGIVLVNVTAYINKGKDAAVKANLSTALTDGAVYYDDNGDYDTFCTDYIAATKPIYEAIVDAVVTAPTCTVKADDTAWCACSILKVTSGNTFCVDSTGAKKETATACATECPAAGACV